MKSLLLAFVLTVAACGGQTKPLNVCLQPSDRIAQTTGCDSSIQPVIAYNENVTEFVVRQMQQPGNVMLWIGKEDWAHLPGWRNRNFVGVLAATAPYIAAGKVTHVYVQDEVDLCPAGPCPGRDTALVNLATEMAHATGLKTVVTMTPNVVLHPGFMLPKVDVIGIDAYYVTMGPHMDTHGCHISSNPTLNQYKCSEAKLRAMGWTGELVFVGAGFGLTTDTHEFRMMYLQLQADAYHQSGAAGVMSYYCHYDPYVAMTEPLLVPLCPTIYAPFVTP